MVSPAAITPHLGEKAVLWLCGYGHLKFDSMSSKFQKSVSSRAQDWALRPAPHVGGDSRSLQRRRFPAYPSRSMPYISLRQCEKIQRFCEKGVELYYLILSFFERLRFRFRPKDKKLRACANFVCSSCPFVSLGPADFVLHPSPLYSPAAHIPGSGRESCLKNSEAMR
jgi:hypothetical protein